MRNNSRLYRMREESWTASVGRGAVNPHKCVQNQSRHSKYKHGEIKKKFTIKEGNPGKTHKYKPHNNGYISKMGHHYQKRFHKIENHAKHCIMLTDDCTIVD